LIDRIRLDIQRRLDQLHAEADKLRHALAALDPRERSTPKPNLTSSRPSATRSATTPAAAKPAPAPARRPADATSTANGASVSTRTAPGQTKAKVLAALSTGPGLTAGEVAAATGLARPTVSTTLSKLSKSGEVVKAERGYRLPSSDARSAGPDNPGAAS
jgi:DNA-binding transcriptional ArsR family regulator